MRDRFYANNSDRRAFLKDLATYSGALTLGSYCEQVWQLRR